MLESSWAAQHTSAIAPLLLEDSFAEAHYPSHTGHLLVAAFCLLNVV